MRMPGLSYTPDYFADDGALRDVFVVDAGIEQWDPVIDALRASRWRLSISLDDEDITESALAAALFDRLESGQASTARMEVCVESICFSTHFFAPSRLEFNFEPTAISGPDDFRHLRAFMELLASATRREVIMTMETSQHEGMPKLLSATP
ncbi:hypothetical protein [Actinoplanes xinjiangensis]|uniref:hypothetical protein n=1 Tax=Actinoplanes xinjiangensis TaxID=512350 RepID=UPI0034350058